MAKRKIDEIEIPEQVAIAIEVIQGVSLKTIAEKHNVTQRLAKDFAMTHEKTAGPIAASLKVVESDTMENVAERAKDAVNRGEAPEAPKRVLKMSETKGRRWKFGERYSKAAQIFLKGYKKISDEVLQNQIREAAELSKGQMTQCWKGLIRDKKEGKLEKVAQKFA